MSRHSKDARVSRRFAPATVTELLANTPTSEWQVTPDSAHKRHRSNLWLTNARVDETGEFSVGFYLPTNYHRPRIVDLMELQRQAGIVFAHSVLGVPAERVFILSTIQLASRLDEDLLDVGIAGSVQVSQDRESAAARLPSGVSLQFSIRTSEKKVAWGTAIARFVTSRSYARLRAFEQGELALEAPARRRRSGLVRFDVDVSDPIISDHDSDHVPAMGLVAGIERLFSDGFVDTASAISSFEIQFDGYLEVSVPVSVAFAEISGEQFKGDVFQRGHRKAMFSAAVSAERGHGRTEPWNGV